MTIVHIELDDSSGVPNRKWKLDEAQSKEFLEYGDWSDMMLPSSLENQLDLGYRGFLITIESSDAESIDLPPSFRIIGPSIKNHGLSKPAAKVLKPNTEIDREVWLLNTAGDLISNEYKEDTKNEILSRKNFADTSSNSTSLQIPKSAVVCNIENTSYVPAWWNNPNWVTRNNCYNYAMNYKTDTFAQPGRKSGLGNIPQQDINCEKVWQRAVRDGCTNQCNPSMKYKDIALVIRPTPGKRDYHWYRKHQGFWSHKMGPTQVKDTDRKGKKITDPATCARGDYVIFCGKGFSPKGMTVA